MRRPQYLKARFVRYGIIYKFPEICRQMSVVGCTIADMDKWYKYTWVCNSCDGLIEMTFDATAFSVPVTNLTCRCGGNTTYVSAVDATIHPTTNERKEMDTQTEDQQVVALQALIQTLESKNESLKTQIENDSVSYNRLRSQINKIIDNLTPEYWYDKSTDKETVLSELCEIIEHEPKATLRFSATIIVEGSIDVPLAEADEYDIRYALQDELTIDSYNGDMEIDSWDVDYVNQDWE